MCYLTANYSHIPQSLPHSNHTPPRPPTTLLLTSQHTPPHLPTHSSSPSNHTYPQPPATSHTPPQPPTIVPPSKNSTHLPAIFPLSSCQRFAAVFTVSLPCHYCITTVSHAVLTTMFLQPHLCCFNNLCSTLAVPSQPLVVHLQNLLPPLSIHVFPRVRGRLIRGPSYI